MLFHTPEFLLFFVVFLVCYLPARGTRWATPVIAVFSSAFYASWDWRFLPLLWVTIVADYFIAAAMVRAPARARTLLMVSIAVNLGILFYFKYWNFLIAPLAPALALRDLVLPLGISFYVFQSMSYVIDVYRKKVEPMTSLLSFAAFVTFFPHLVAGPIQRLQQLAPQLARPAAITASRVLSGATLFAAGFLRKSGGDLLASWHDPVFAALAQAEPATVVAAVFTFGLQIYLDFAGYSEMAVGLARMLGVDLIDNFQAPYLSTSIQEFWRRWHISLSLWLRDYLYISLGGSRAGLARQAANLLVTMTVCGLWHGAGWTFVIWGVLHGAFLAANLWLRLRPLPALLGWALTFGLTNYFWLYFRARTFEDAMTGNAKITTWLRHPVWPAAPPGIWIILLAVLLSDLWIRHRGYLVPLEIPPPTLPRAVAWGLLCGVLLALAIVLSAGRPTEQFIYFQF
ncbi:MAG: MBOAT family protein [Bryobacterales bacterium]|nr:MBOAT family protein [Bryobacterales bacterium]